MIEFQGVSKRFGRRVALADVTFTAPAAAITGLIGPNGAGKTTLLRLLAGLLRPDTGAVVISGRAALEPDVRRHLGVLTEAQGLYARLTVREHIHYAGGLHGLSGPRLRHRTDELLSLLDLETLADERTAGFSRGQQTRVALARALVHRPSVLLLDEPTSALDIPSARTVRAVLRQLRQEGACILLATHVMSELEELADGLVLLADGRVVADGTPDQLREWTQQSRLEDAFVVAIAARSQVGLRVSAATGARQSEARAAGSVAPRGGGGGLWREARVVLLRELVEYGRDRPARIAGAVFAILTLLVLAVPQYALPSQALQGLFQPVRIGVVGADLAPALIAYLAEQQVVVAPASPDPVEAVRSGSVDVVLVVSHEYAEQLEGGQPAQVQLIADSGRTSSDKAREYVSSALLGYGQRLGRARLLARGLDPAITDGVQVSLEDVSQSTGGGALERAEAQVYALATLLMFSLTSASLAVQMTAGERERRTMESLLNETSRRAALVLGKSGAALAFGLLSGAVTLLGLAVAVAFIPLGSILGVPAAGSVLLSLFGLLLVGPPLVVLQMAMVAAFAGSADAATNRTMLLTLVLLGMVGLTVSAAPYSTLPHVIPVFGALALMAEILLGQPPGFAASGAVLLGSVASTLLGLLLVTRLYEREAITRS